MKNLQNIEMVEVNLKFFLPDHPSQLGCPDVLSLVGGPLSGNGCGSLKRVWFTETGAVH